MECVRGRIRSIVLTLMVCTLTLLTWAGVRQAVFARLLILYAYLDTVQVVSLDKHWLVARLPGTEVADVAFVDFVR